METQPPGQGHELIPGGSDPGSDTHVSGRRIAVRSYNQRMAQRVARRARLDEHAVAVAFTYNNLLTMVVFGGAEEVVRFIPAVGALVDIALSLLSFYFHRIVIVTDDNVYVYRDLPLHFPGRQLSAYSRGPGVVRLGSPNPESGISRFIRRGQLTFNDGTVVYHQFLWIRRVRYIEQEGNIPAGGY
jgi:hypothetical protein